MTTKGAITIRKENASPPPPSRGAEFVWLKETISTKSYSIKEGFSKEESNKEINIVNLPKKW